MKSVAECLKRAHTGKFTAVKTKYSAKQMMKIALNTEISDKLAELWKTLMFTKSAKMTW